MRRKHVLLVLLLSLLSNFTVEDGNLMVKVVFEPNSNFWKETLTWVPTVKEIGLSLTLFWAQMQ